MLLDDEKGYPDYKPYESPAEKIDITKPLYYVEDEEGDYSLMTKKKAKDIYSPRQVRKALHAARKQDVYVDREIVEELIEDMSERKAIIDHQGKDD